MPWKTPKTSPSDPEQSNSRPPIARPGEGRCHHHAGHATKAVIRRCQLITSRHFREHRFHLQSIRHGVLTTRITHQSPDLWTILQVAPRSFFELHFPFNAGKKKAGEPHLRGPAFHKRCTQWKFPSHPAMKPMKTCVWRFTGTRSTQQLQSIGLIKNQCSQRWLLINPAYVSSKFHLQRYATDSLQEPST